MTLATYVQRVQLSGPKISDGFWFQPMKTSTSTVRFGCYMWRTKIMISKRQINHANTNKHKNLSFTKQRNSSNVYLLVYRRGLTFINPFYILTCKQFSSTTCEVVHFYCYDISFYKGGGCPWQWLVEKAFRQDEGRLLWSKGLVSIVIV